MKLILNGQVDLVFFQVGFENFKLILFSHTLVNLLTRLSLADFIWTCINAINEIRIRCDNAIQERLHYRSIHNDDQL